MSHSSSLFNRVPIDLPNKSGFNLDHENLFTATCGTLTPAYCKPLLPGEKISMGVNFQCQLPPMVTDFYGKIDAVFEAFFVPNRLLWKGWTDFITHPSENPTYPVGTNYAAKPSMKPRISITSNNQGLFRTYFSPGSLADYLGSKFSLENDILDSDIRLEIDALPFFAYHMIYDKWYRDTRIQSPVFVPMPVSGAQLSAMYLPDISVTSSSDLRGPAFGPTALLGDGSTLGSLRQRNWSKGYFTTASPYAQGGQPTELSFDVVDGQGAISIAALRSANAIQQWKERNNFSYDYADQIYYQYGVYPSSARLSKPIFLGRTKQVVYNRSVMQTAPGDSTLNDVVGAKKASSQCIGEGRLFDDFMPTEHGYLMVIFSLVPHAYYGTGTARHFIELETEDIPFPLLAGTGDQPIYVWELAESIPSDGALVFGFTDRYAHYKYDEDEVHGLLRDGSSLESYCLQRTFFNEDVELSSAFLQIPRSALDQVQAVETASSGFSTWVDCFFKCTKVSPLPAYSLPTLGDIKNTHKGYASRGGSHL